MKRAGPHRETWRPTPEQTLLLRACLFQGAPAREALNQWCERVKFDEMDGGSYRLTPLLYHNLREVVDASLAARLKGIYRHTWSRNQMLFHAMLPALRALKAAGIRVMILKGVALALVHYRDAGLRPMNDFDCLVPREDALRAFDVLEKNGWHCVEANSPERLLWCAYAAKFRNRHGQETDLHWHLLPEGQQPRADDDLWRGAERVNFLGEEMLCANAADLLLHVCAHGTVGDVVPPIRWIADAWTILKNSPDAMDWERLLGQAQKRSLTLSTGRALEFLKNEFGAPVPSRVVVALKNTRHSWLERWIYRIKSRPHGATGALPLHCANYLRLAADKSLPAKILGAPRFFQNVWGLPAAWNVPGFVTVKAWSSLRKSFR